MDETKVCDTCLKRKPEGEFPLLSGYLGTRGHTCISCTPISFEKKPLPSTDGITLDLKIGDGRSGRIVNEDGDVIGQQCNRCKRVKDLSWFCVDMADRWNDGLARTCIPCAGLERERSLEKKERKKRKRKRSSNRVKKEKIKAPRKPIDQDPIRKRRPISVTWKRLGLTADQGFYLLKCQRYRCKICDKKLLVPESGKGIVERNDRPCLDHNHTTNKVRGFLCHGCNTGIGLLGENVEVLQKAIAYLQASPPIIPDRDKIPSFSVNPVECNGV